MAGMPISEQSGSDWDRAEEDESWYESGREAGAADERAAIVRWLRKMAAGPLKGYNDDGVIDKGLAQDIENGEHLKGP